MFCSFRKRALGHSDADNVEGVLTVHATPSYVKVWRAALAAPGCASMSSETQAPPSFAIPRVNSFPQIQYGSKSSSFHVHILDGMTEEEMKSKGPRVHIHCFLFVCLFVLRARERRERETLICCSTY